MIPAAACCRAQPVLGAAAMTLAAAAAAAPLAVRMRRLGLTHQTAGALYSHSVGFHTPALTHTALR
jgi:hypothetical protein